MHPIRNTAVHSKPSYALDPMKLEFGKTFSPNYFCMEYRGGEWKNARIEPLQNLSLHPGAIVFHYGQAIFEGLKAYVQDNGRVVIFRPDMNAKRMNRSAARMAMAAIDEAFYVEAVKELVKTEVNYIPRSPGSMYIRPTMVGTEACLGVRGSSDFLFYVITLPTGAYFKEAAGGLGSVRVLVAESVYRAARGGTGAAKAAANYAVTIQIIAEARKKSCSQVLFLDASGKRLVEEMGGMNVFFVRDGKLVTPPLSDTILAGITRDSILTLSKDLGITAQEEPVNIDEALADIKSGRISEAMACGTAAVITAIGELQLENGTVIKLGDGTPGPMTKKLYERLTGIQSGKYADNHRWIVDVCAAP